MKCPLCQAEIDMSKCISVLEEKMVLDQHFSMDHSFAEMIGVLKELMNK